MPSGAEYGRRYRRTHCALCHRPLAVGLRYYCMICRLMLQRIAQYDAQEAQRHYTEPAAVRRGRGITVER